MNSFCNVVDAEISPGDAWSTGQKRSATTHHRLPDRVLGRERRNKGAVVTLMCSAIAAVVIALGV